MSLEHQQEEIIGDRYRVIDILGRGSSGITYQVEDLNTKQEVALKALSLHRLKDWKQIELFEREAEVLAKLNHPAIPQYLDYFQIDTPNNRTFYIAQALALGKPLSAWVDSGWRTREKDIKNIAQQVLLVLSYLHSLDPPIIHRDIKPQNIIRSQDGKIFLVDFGAVQNTYHNTLMQGSTVVGTYGYMAPEQFRGKAVPATDLYSLGATLLYLLTHKSPAELPQDTLKLDFRASVNISEEFGDWLEKMLEPSLEYRYTSANEALLKLNREQEVNYKKRLEVNFEAIPVAMTFVLFFILWLSFCLIAYQSLFGEILSLSPHWKILSRFKYYPLNICHSYKSMNQYMRSGGSMNISIANRYGKPKQLSECRLESSDRGHINLYNQVLFDDSARANDFKTIELLIDKGVDVSFQGESKKFTALHWAVYNQNFLMVKRLIEKGADINIVASHPFGNSWDFDYPYHVTPAELALDRNYSIYSFFISGNHYIVVDDSLLYDIKRAVRNNDIKFIKLMLGNKFLSKSLKENVLYEYEHSKMSLLDFARENGTDEMSKIIEHEFSK